MKIKKVAVINLSGNTGKTTSAKQLFLPRIPGAKYKAVESINAGAGENHEDQMRGKDFIELQEFILLNESVVIDIGASNVEALLMEMQMVKNSHIDFDLFVVPVVSEKKQQTDTINTIRTLAAMGVPPTKIVAIFNKVQVDDAGNLINRFIELFAFHDEHKLFMLNEDAVIYANPVFDLARVAGKLIVDIVADPTDYRALLATLKGREEREECVRKIQLKGYAEGATDNLNAVFDAVMAGV